MYLQNWIAIDFILLPKRGKQFQRYFEKIYISYFCFEKGVCIFYLKIKLRVYIA